MRTTLILAALVLAGCVTKPPDYSYNSQGVRLFDHRVGTGRYEDMQNARVRELRAEIQALDANPFTRFGDPSAAYQMIQPRLTLAAHLFVMAVRTFL